MEVEGEEEAYPLRGVSRCVERATSKRVGRVLAAAAVTGCELSRRRLIRLVTADADTVVEVVGRCVLACWCLCSRCDEGSEGDAAAGRTCSGMRTAGSAGTTLAYISY